MEALIVAYLSHLESRGRSPATVRRYRQLWRQWLSPTLADLAPAAVDPTKLEEAVHAMADAGQSSSSVHQAAILLSGCFRWVKRHGSLGTNPAFGLRLPDGTRLASPRLR